MRINALVSVTVFWFYSMIHGRKHLQFTYIWNEL